MNDPIYQRLTVLLLMAVAYVAACIINAGLTWIWRKFNS